MAQSFCDQHGYKYDPDEDNLVKESGNIIIFNKTGDNIYETIFYCIIASIELSSSLLA